VYADATFVNLSNRANAGDIIHGCRRGGHTIHSPHPLGHGVKANTKKKGLIQDINIKTTIILKNVLSRD
jgi:hypothetical protein